MNMKIVKTQIMRDIDYEAIHEYGIASILLMEHAAMHVCDYIKAHIQKDKKILILCGHGNNGGDGFALGRLLVIEGYQHVNILCSVPYQNMSHDEAVYARIAESYHIPIIQSEDMEVIQPLLDKQDCVIDALFGIGLNRAIEGFYSGLILRLNQSSAYIISIDIPSGIHGDTGEIMGCAVQADTTITFECMKIGQLLYPGSAYCGNIIVKRIGIPEAILDKIPTYAQVLTRAKVQQFLPKRMGHSHKGTYGKVLMIGGSSSMHGAITLSAKAALKSGLGTLTLMVPESIRTILSAKIEECMLLPIPDRQGFFDEGSADILSKHLDAYDCIVIGNGMGRREAVKKMVHVVLKSNKPCILDADALFAAGSYQALLKERKALTILTPHPKELCYLSGKNMQDIMKNPIHFAREFVCEYPAVVMVLKDQYTIICDHHHVYVNLIGNHALAKGGSGDVLCGILSGLFAQGKDGLASACSAVYVHAYTGDVLRKEMDAYSILPNDMIRKLSDVYRSIKEDEIV